MKAIDSLSARYGRDTITFAASGRKPGWKLRSDFVSLRYTTAWEESLTIDDRIDRCLLAQAARFVRC